MSSYSFEIQQKLETYLNGIKVVIVQICDLEGKMPDAARIEILELGVDAAFAFLSQRDIERWIRNNDEMNIYAFHEFAIFQTLLANADSKLVSEINGLSHKAHENLQFTCNVWSATLKSLFGTLSTPSTLRSLIKYYEVGRIAHSELNNNPHSLLIEEDANSFGKILRQRLKEVTGEQTQVQGAIVTGTLLTRLSSEEWTTIIAELSMSGYVSLQYLDHPQLIADWIYFAFSFEKESVLRSSFSDRLLWEGTPRSLAELLRKSRAVGAIEYSTKNKEQLYQWLDRCIAVKGKRNSIVTYLKRQTLKSDCFTITRSNSGSILFEMNHVARKVMNV